jgi:hypothetical protein
MLQFHPQQLFETSVSSSSDQPSLFTHISAALHAHYQLYRAISSLKFQGNGYVISQQTQPHVVTLQGRAFALLVMPSGTVNRHRHLLAAVL